MDYYCNNKYIGTYINFQASIINNLGYSSEDVYYIHNGHLAAPETIQSGTVHIVPRLYGGKGGFGSMLRAIGAQIEKTTNREACRDLSGRRLRDINEEKRLQSWIDQQAERERETAERKRKKLERLCQKPKHEFNDANYEKERSELPDRVENAVEQGMMMAASTSGKCAKRKADSEDQKKKKKRKLWMEDDMSDLSSSVSSGDEENKGEELLKVDSKTEHEEVLSKPKEDDETIELKNTT